MTIPKGGHSKRRRPKIVVIGSINMDLVLLCSRLPKPGETLAASECHEVSGGKGANQAVAAARMGAEVTLVGRVGNDAFAQKLISNLQSCSVDISHVHRSADCGSGVAVVMVDKAGQNSIVIVPGANGQVSPGDIEGAEELIRQADMVILQLEIPLDTVAAAISLARQHGIPILLNPAPAISPLPDRLFQVDIFCPNQTEAELLTGLRVKDVNDAKLAAKSLLGRGAKRVAITMGSEGVVTAEQKSDDVIYSHTPSITVEAVDTTAAGDAFIGALATYVSEYQEWSLACRFACIAGALTATKLGAQASLPYRAEVERVLKDTN